jgi:quercetin dioxygenase-like cupin family protein
MKGFSRRDLCLAPLSSVGVGSSTKIQTWLLEEPERSGHTTLSKSEVLFLDRTPDIARANGGKSWNILHGTLATGEAIAVHESLQPAGVAPSPPHEIQHSEIILVEQGTLLFEHNGTSEKVNAGGVIFVAFGTRHAARNIGDGPAKYLVLAIGGDTR